MTVFHEKNVAKDINDAQLRPAFNRMVSRLCDAGGITKKAIGKGVLWSKDRLVGALAIGGNCYFCVDEFEPESLPGVTILCAFNFFADEDARANRPDEYVRQKCNRADRRAVVSDDELIQYAESILNEQKESIVKREKPDLPPQYKGWVQSVKIDSAIEKSILAMVVRETESWGNSFRAHLVGQEIAHSLYERLQEVFFLASCDEGVNIDGDRKCITHVRGDYYVLIVDKWRFLCKFSLDELDELGEQDENGQIQKTKCRVLTLVDMWEAGLCEEEQEQKIEAYEKNYGGINARRPLRFYPGSIFDDSGNGFQKWLDLERRTMPVTFEFSQEEARIIHGTKKAFPMFVNGSAGSGKSTVLYYLFANYWLKARADQRKDSQVREFDGKPIFLTLSSRLRDHAFETVKDIIWFDVENADSEYAIEEALRGNFYSFDDVLRKILGETASALYVEDCEVQFELFKDLLEGSGSLPAELEKYKFKGRRQEKYSPELCWHIIRSYIKGYPGRDFSDEEAFLRFVRNLRGDRDIFIDEAECKYVWENIWPWYRKWTVESVDCPLWDRQDMALAALRHMQTPGNHSPAGLDAITAVFCDEAQDFTGVEMCIVQNLSLLLKYKLPKEFCPELPFAFAGDPLQTLNPSGFRWADLKRTVKENMLDPSRAEHELHPYHLQKNYRSPCEIVKLANMVQLSRKMLFGDAIIPQKPDKTYAGDIFYAANLDGKTDISEQEVKGLADSVILLPCSPGKEDAFIAEYPLLADIKAKCKDEVEILSVLEAKGLDISRVVLFAFGDNLFGAEGKAFPETTDGTNRDISFSYALNKVYVGITRAVEQIQILDTQKGAENFWAHIGFGGLRGKYLHALEEEEQSKRKSNYREIWEKLVPSKDIDFLSDSGLGFGKNSMSDLERFDEASRWFDNAYLQGNAKQMMAVAHRFGRLAREPEKNVCEGFSLKFEKKYDEAANAFMLALGDESARPASAKVILGSKSFDLHEQVLQCLWESMSDSAWKMLHSLAYATKAQRLVAEVMCAAQIDIPLLERVIASDEEVFQQMRGIQWNKCLARLYDFVDDLHLGRDNGVPPEHRGVLMDFVAFSKKYVIDRFPAYAKTLLTVFIYLAESKDDRRYWDEAYKLIREFASVAGMADACDWVKAHCAPAPDYVRYCQNIGAVEFCCERWMSDASADKDVNANAKLSGPAKRFLVESLLRMATMAARESSAAPRSAAEYEREAVRTAFAMDEIGPILDRVEAFPDLLDGSQKMRCLTMMMSAVHPEWERLRSLVVRILMDCRTTDEVNGLIDAIGNAADITLLDKRMSIIADALVEVLKRRETSALWPTSATDIERLGGVLTKIGLNKPMVTIASYVIENARFSARDDIRAAAVELYVFARRRFSDDHGTHNPAAIKSMTRTYLVKQGIIADSQNYQEGNEFEEYWDAARGRRYAILPPGLPEGDRAKSEAQAPFRVCVEGAKFDDVYSDGSLKVFTRTVGDFDFVETEGKVVVRRGKMPPAVIMKSDWNNQSFALQNVGLTNGSGYQVNKRGILVTIPVSEGKTVSLSLTFI